MACRDIRFPESAVIVKYKIKPGSVINHGTVVCEYRLPSDSKLFKYKSDCSGTVKELLVKEGQEVQAGSILLNVEQCRHLTIWRNMCAECGLDLREEKALKASVAMEHMIPDLLISEKRAQVLGREDEYRLFKNRKLVLLVDLDQTLIHTTNDAIPANLKDVYHFQLWPHPAWYHTKFRPHLESFLESMCRLYELHICTFGTRTYAHTIARFLDPDGRYFQQRILSRDECFHPTLKTSNLKALFPCGDSMVCIIDDREDVWKMANNLVHVRPYRFFVGTADINAPPEASKAGVDPAVDEARGNMNKTIRHSSKVVRVPKNSTAKFSLSTNKKEIEIVETSVSDTLVESKDKNNEVEAEQTVVDTQLTDETDCSVAKGGSASRDSDTVKSDEDCAQIVLKTQVVEPSCDEVKDVDTLATDEHVIQAVVEKPSHRAQSIRQDPASTDVQPVSDYKSSETTNTPNTTHSNDDQEYDELVEWEDSDDYLIYLEEILTRIHTVYYKFYDEMQNSEGDKVDMRNSDGVKVQIPDLKTVVPYVRRKVLKGAYIVFSGVCPLDTDTTKSRIYRVAESLGAVIQQSVVSVLEDENPMTTHLIAARLGTQKAKAAARCKSIRIVNPDWLWACADRWEWVDERLYPLNEEASTRFLSRDSPDSMKAGRRMKGTTGSLDKVNQTVEETPCSLMTDGKTTNLFSNNPLYAFSKEDITGMDAEVEELMDETDTDNDDDKKGASGVGSVKKLPSERLIENDDDKIETEDEITLRQKVLSAYGKKRSKCDDSSDEDADSLCADFPKGWKLNSCKRTKSIKVDRDNDDDDDDNEDDNRERDNDGKTTDGSDASSRSQDDEDFNESVGSVDDEIAAAVEREFLS